MGQAPKSIWGMLVAAAVAAAAFTIIIWKFDPYNSSRLVFGLFFFSFFIMVSGLIIPSLYFYQLKRGLLDITEGLNTILQQSLVISTTITIFFALQTIHVLSWWNGLLILIIAVILSMYFKK
ncbi:hypothetical protein KKE14_01080 [Patescibacteria group bacterium]|nr:hypothetical protein [Patescibacteria group bacterium]